jgi:hypothetical protein
VHCTRGLTALHVLQHVSRGTGLRKICHMAHVGARHRARAAPAGSGVASRARAGRRARGAAPRDKTRLSPSRTYGFTALFDVFVYELAFELQL